MKLSYKFQLLACLTFIALIGCRKVIDINIPFDKEVFVIEGTLNDSTNSCKVSLSKVVPINDSNYLAGVNGAVVTVAEDNKTPLRLAEKGEGIYERAFKGKPGHTYSLSVKINGENFTATSLMPQKVYIDSIFVSDRLFLGKQRKIASVAFKDPPGKGNAYRFIQYVNGSMENNIFVLDDNLIDGNNVVYDLLFFDEDYTLLKDDQLRVVLRCIDKPVYQYYNSLLQSSLGQTRSSSPGNPISNIKGGALGYFSAFTFDAKYIAVQ